MYRTRITAALSAITMLMLPLLAAAAHRPAAPVATGSIAGSVRANGAPVANATVNVWRDGKQVSSVAVTGDHFTFSGPEATYEVQASAPNYRPAVAARITVVVHQDRETWVNLVLVAGQ
jgi:Carboxypeptidase regulatory-like domain